MNKNFNKWLDLFIEEKKLENIDYVIEYKGFQHHIEMDLLVDIIKHSSAEERKIIKNEIVKIDFKNGDIHKYFKFLAECYIKENY